MRFPAKKNAGCPKAPLDFPPRKDGIVYPRRVVLGLPSPSHRVCADGRTDGRVTIKSEPKFLGLIVYPGGSDELVSSAGSRCLAIVTSRREKCGSLPSLQKWRWQTDVRVRTTNVFFVLLSFQLSLFSWVMEF